MYNILKLDSTQHCSLLAKVHVVHSKRSEAVNIQSRGFNAHEISLSNTTFPWRVGVDVPKQRAVPDLDLAHESPTNSDPTIFLLHLIDIDARITTPFD
jgi:hypothetical protein